MTIDNQLIIEVDPHKNSSGLFSEQYDALALEYCHICRAVEPLTLQRGSWWPGVNPQTMLIILTSWRLPASIYGKVGRLARLGISIRTLAVVLD